MQLALGVFYYLWSLTLHHSYRRVGRSLEVSMIFDLGTDCSPTEVDTDDLAFDLFIAAAI